MRETCFTDRFIRMIGMVVVAVFQMAALSSCADDLLLSENQPSDEAAMLSIGFRVSTPVNAFSRAENTVFESRGGGYEDGSDMESYIDFESYSYRVYFFDKDDKFIAEWDRIAKMHVIVYSGYLVYEFKGAVPDDLQKYNEDYKDFSVMVLANWPDYPDYHSVDPTDMNINDFVTADWSKFKAFDSFELSKEDNRLIPLYGLGSFKDITLIKGSTCDLGSINLLRAMAKVEVNLKGLPDDVALEGNPVIRGINPGGFCAPVGSFGSGNNWDTDYVSDLHLPFESNQNHVMAMDNSADMRKVEDGKWIAYLPEFRNIGQENFSRIELKLSHSNIPFVINFANYNEDGMPDNANGRFDIRRNDLYRFNVEGDLHEIKFKLSVEEWQFGNRTEIEM